MKFEEVESNVATYRRLSQLAEKYREIIESMNKEPEKFTPDRIRCWAGDDHSPVTIFDLDPEHTIPVSYLILGIQEALVGIETDAQHIRKELYKIGIEP